MSLLAVALLLGALPLSQAGPRRASPDDEAEEQEVAEVRVALQKDQALRRHRVPVAPARGAAQRRAWDLLPEAGAVAEAAFSYGLPASAPGAGQARFAVELGLAKTLDPYVRVAAYALAEPTGLSLLEAAIGTAFLPAGLQVRAGALLLPLGAQNRRHPHALPMLVRPAPLTRVFGDDGGRGLGAQLSWRVPLPFSLLLDATVSSASGARTAASFYGDRGPASVRGPQDLLYVLSARGAAPLPGALTLVLGASAALGPNASGRHNRTDVYAADLTLRAAPRGRLHAVELISEWLWRRRQVPGDVAQDLSGYVEISAQLSAGGGVLRAGGRYEYLGPDVTAPMPEPRQRAALLLGGHIGRFLLVRGQGELDHGASGLSYAATVAVQAWYGQHGAEGLAY